MRVTWGLGVSFKNLGLGRPFKKYRPVSNTQALLVVMVWTPEVQRKLPEISAFGQI